MKNKDISNQEILRDNSFKRNIIQRSIYGIMMGVSDGIPGYSGGTTLSLINFYETLIEKFKGIFKPFNKHVWWRNILWLLPFVLFWGISLLAFSVIGDLVSSGSIFNKQIFYNSNGEPTGYPIVLIFTFAFFSIFSIPLFVKANKPKILEFENKKIKKINIKNSTLFIVGFLLILVISLVIFFVQGGISLVDADAKIQKIDYTFPNILLIPLSMFVAGFAMLIPGISGSLVLYMFNTYDEIMWVILHHPITNIGYIAICGVAAILGILTCIFSTSWLIKKFKEEFYAFCFGMICSSFIAILLVGKRHYVDFLDLNTIPLILCSFVVVVGINIALFLYIKNSQTKVIEGKEISQKNE